MAKFALVFPHPDDETFSVGGTTALLAQSHDVYLVCCTNGNHQSLNLKSIRVQELARAAEILKIKQVFHLDFEDGHLCNANYHLLAASVRKVLDLIQPETIITYHPNGYSGHIDHMVVTSVVNYLFDRLSYLKSIWYCSRPSTQPRSPDYFVYQPEGLPIAQMHKSFDATPVWPQVAQAIRAHASQMADGEKLLAAFQNSPKIEYFIVRQKV